MIPAGVFPGYKSQVSCIDISFFKPIEIAGLYYQRKSGVGFYAEKTGQVSDLFLVSFLLRYLLDPVIKPVDPGHMLPACGDVLIQSLTAQCGKGECVEPAKVLVGPGSLFITVWG